jgi:hypothetical protein
MEACLPSDRACGIRYGTGVVREGEHYFVITDGAVVSYVGSVQERDAMLAGSPSHDVDQSGTDEHASACLEDGSSPSPPQEPRGGRSALDRLLFFLADTEAACREVVQV